MVGWEGASDDGRAEGSCGVERSTGKEDTSQLGNEERETDTNWREECSAVLLDGKL